MTRTKGKRTPSRSHQAFRRLANNKVIPLLLFLLLVPVGYKTFQLVEPAEAFIPTNLKACPLCKPGISVQLGTSHEQITKNAITQFLALHFNISPPSGTTITAMKEIADANAAVDLDQYHSEKHFDGENFLGGQNRLIRLAGFVKTRMDFKLTSEARISLGEALHTLQDFYSHSNWVELQGLMISTDLGRPNRLLVSLPQSVPTCIGCTLSLGAPCGSGLIGNYGFDCTNNLSGAGLLRLTSGYFAGATSGIEDIAKPNASKCSHGGLEDTSSLPFLGTGINKDSLDCGLSPHFALHEDAVTDATVATVQFISDLENLYGVTDRQLRTLLGVGPGITMVIDTTGSMSGILDQVKAQAIQIVDKRIGTPEEPSEYVLDPFNDQKAGPVTVTNNADDFKAAISRLVAGGGVDLPEVQNAAMVQGLSASDKDSDLFMFTCATSKDGSLASSVSGLAESRDIKIYVSFFRACSGTAWAWGYNSVGQLGNGTFDFTAHSTPGQVTETDSLGNVGTFVGVSAIAAGGDHNLGVKGDGTIWAWGSSFAGESGRAPFLLNCSGASCLATANPRGLDGITAVAAATYHSLALQSNGTVWAWGDNVEGQLGNPDLVRPIPGYSWTVVPVIDPSDPTGILTDIVAIAAGGDNAYGHSLAVKSGGTVWAWGSDYGGELGIDPASPSVNKTCSACSFTPVQVPGVSDVVKVSGGRFFSLALKKDGTVWAWGDNSYGQMGNGTTTNSKSSCLVSTCYSFTPPAQVLSGAVAISAGEFHSLALRSDGTVWGWGLDDDGQLGLAPSGSGGHSPIPTPVQVSGVSGAVAIAAGYHHSLALKSDGTIWAWGSNGAGELGNGSNLGGINPTPVQVINPTDPTGKLTGGIAIAAGSQHSLALAVPPNATAVTLASSQPTFAKSFSIVTPAASTSSIDPSYVSAAADSGGQLFLLSPADAGKITTLADLLERSNSAELLAITDSAVGSAKTYSVPVDSTLSALNFVVSGSVPNVPLNLTLQRPDGSTVLATDAGVTMIMLSGGSILNVTSPITGSWTATVSGGSGAASQSYSLKVSGESTLHLSHFRFVEPGGRSGHEGYYPIAGLPVANQPVVFDALVDGLFSTVNFEFRGADGSVITPVAVSPVPDGPNGEFSGSLTLPKVPFLIYATGADQAGKSFQRVISSPTQAQTVRVTAPIPQILAPSQLATYSFTVQNLGPDDTFAVTAADGAQYVTSVIPASFALANNTAQMVTVTLQPPATAAPGTSDTLIVTAQSTTVPALRNFAVVTSSIGSDTVPPITTAVVSPQPNAAGWNNTNVTVTLNSTDNEPGGTGVMQIQWSLTGAQIASSTVPGNTTTVTISAEGTTTLTYFGTDNVGNIEGQKAVTIKLDRTPPNITAARTPAQNGSGWNNSPVTVGFQCADALSGLAAGSPPAPMILSSQGAGQSVSGTCQDLAGNTSTATVSGINIDETPPTIGITTPANGATYTSNQLVNAAYACNDAVSGVATCSGTVPSGSKIDTAPSGVSTTKTFTVNAADVAGNATSQLVSYQVSCHYVALGISPSTVSRGSTVKVTGTVMSCTNVAQTVSVKFTLTGPLGPKSCANTGTVMFTTPPFTIQAGTPKSVSFPFLIPKSACSGTFITTATTLIGGVPVDSISATLTVQ